MTGSGNQRIQWLTAGFLFAALWASASTATKLGLTAAQPLVIAVVRFGIAAAILLTVSHGLKGQRLPQGKEWKQLAVYGLLNITIYLGLYVMAMQTVTAGIGALAVASNPVFIAFLSLLFRKEKLNVYLVLSIITCAAGVFCAAWPLLGNATIHSEGLMLMLLSMLSYSLGASYFSSREWNGLPLLAVNGWQTLLGGLFLLPFMIYSYDRTANDFNKEFWLSVGWLAVPVSIFAVQFWLWLLRVNTVKAGLWLFLCPPFGFAIAAWLMKDQITGYTILGVVMVCVGLLLSKRNKVKNEVVFD